MKKILAMILALTLVAGLAACKNDTQDNTTENMTENTTAPEATEPSTEATEPSDTPTTEATEPSVEPTGPTVEEENGERHYYLADSTEFCTEMLDDSGKLTLRLAYRDGALYRSWEYKYDDSGDLDCVNEYDAEGDQIGYCYCGGTELVTEITAQGLKDSYYEDGVLVKTGEYYHDWSLREATYDDGVLEYSCEYDADGYLVAETHYEKGLAFWSIRHGDIEETAFYNEKGQMIQQFGFEGLREIWCGSFTYDEEGDLIAETLTETAGNENVDERKRYVYDGDRVRAYNAQEGLVYSARYDELGRLLWETYGCPYGEYGEYTDSIDYDYNDDGSYTTVWVGATGGLYYSSYDKDGNLLEYCGGDDPGENPEEMPEWEIYGYNEYGDRISFDEYEFGELKSSHRFEYVYDEDGNWIEMVSYRDGEQAARTFQTYDDQGRLIEAVSENGIYHCTYTYDEAGNLTEEREEMNFAMGPYTGIYTYTYDESGRITQEICRSISG